MQLLRFHLMEDVDCETEIKRELEKKLDKMVRTGAWHAPVYSRQGKAGKENHTMREGRLGYNCENGR